MKDLKDKVIYLIATGCRRSAELPQFIKNLESKGAKVYLFATESCEKMIDFGNDEFKNINLRLMNNTSKTMEIEKEDIILVAPCSFNTLNKIANGIADSYPLSIIQTAIGRGTDVIICASMNIDLWNNFNIKKSIDTISNVKNITFIWPDIICDDDGKEVSTTMVSWDKIEDTIMATLHILPFDTNCIALNNKYNSKNNLLYDELFLAGKMCKEIYICQNSAGCIAKKLEDGILISSTGSFVGDLELEDMVLIKKYADGIIYYEGSKKPSSESIIAWETLKDTPDGTCFIHCHCKRITYSIKSKDYTTSNYFMSKNKEQIQEVKDIIKKYGFVNLYLHGQIFVGDSFENIMGNILHKYCE